MATARRADYRPSPVVRRYNEALKAFQTSGRLPWLETEPPSEVSASSRPSALTALECKEDVPALEKLVVAPHWNGRPAARAIERWSDSLPDLSDEGRYWGAVAVPDVLLQILVRPRFRVPTAWLDDEIDFAATVVSAVRSLIQEPVPSTSRGGPRARARLLEGNDLTNVSIVWDCTKTFREKLAHLERCLLRKV